ncbi:hypothetical protein, partial [Thiolapillus sp.]
MTRTAGAPMGCQRPSRFWGLGCPKIYHEAEDTLAFFFDAPASTASLINSTALRRSGTLIILPLCPPRSPGLFF